MSELSDKVVILEMKEKRRIQEKEQRQKELKAIEEKKRQAKEQKEYEKDLFLACKLDLQAEFEAKIDEFGFDKKFELYNIILRNELINKTGETTPSKNYLDTNYNRFLNETLKKYELNEKYKEEKQKEELAQELEEMAPIYEQKRKQQEKVNICINIFKISCKILKWFFIILFGGIFFVFKISF